MRTSAEARLVIFDVCTLLSDPGFKDLIRRIGLPEINVAALNTQ